MLVHMSTTTREFTKSCPTCHVEASGHGPQWSQTCDDLWHGYPFCTCGEYQYPADAISGMPLMFVKDSIHHFDGALCNVIDQPHDHVAEYREQLIDEGLLPNPNQCSAVEWRSPVTHPLLSIYSQIIDRLGDELHVQIREHDATVVERNKLHVQLDHSRRALAWIRDNLDCGPTALEIIGYALEGS